MILPGEDSNADYLIITSDTLGEHPKDCPECERYRDHPINRGICDDRWRQIHKERADIEFAENAQRHGMREIARAALAHQEGEEEG